MASPTQKLATSLEILKELQDTGETAIQSSQLTRTHRERLVKSGFLQEAIKGWYIISNPSESTGDSTTWYTSYWLFCARYLTHRFDDSWCLSPEQSLTILTGDKTVPEQLLVRAPTANNKTTALPFNTSIFELRTNLPTDDALLTTSEGLKLYSLPAALLACSASFFQKHTTEAYAALNMIKDASELLPSLLDLGQTTIAGRLAGAFRHLERHNIADDIVNAMQTAGHRIREENPFDTKMPIPVFRERSPYANRICLLWETMRGDIITHFPAASDRQPDIKIYLQQVEDTYVTDAYHSLSIEGYKVSPELIERVRSGNWHPEINTDDKTDRNALAARGYWQAYQAVRKSITHILQGEAAGLIVEADLSTWYRELFAPSVTVGLLRPSDLAGYRNSPVYIRRSMHVPPSPEAVRDSMPTFFKLLANETDSAVRIVLGHFIFVYIHPYMDGNGRIGRFLMNTMLAAGGYPWLVIPIEQRQQYMAALEEASVRQNIRPFTQFIAKLLR